MNLLNMACGWAFLPLALLINLNRNGIGVSGGKLERIAGGEVPPKCETSTNKVHKCIVSMKKLYINA